MHSGHSPKSWRVGGSCVYVTGSVAAQLYLFGSHRHMPLIGCARSANVKILPAANLGLLLWPGEEGKWCEGIDLSHWGREAVERQLRESGWGRNGWRLGKFREVDCNRGSVNVVCGFGKSTGVSALLSCSQYSLQIKTLRNKQMWVWT